MENTSSSKSKLPFIIIIILIFAINIFVWAIFWLLDDNTQGNDIPQPAANDRVIPLAVEADHPAVTEASVNYVYSGQIFSQSPVTIARGSVVELQLTAQGQIVPQTFFIDEQAQQMIFQRGENEENDKIIVSDLQVGDTVEIRTNYNLKTKTDTIVSIVRTNQN